jgi:hypothetical protein
MTAVWTTPLLTELTLSQEQMKELRRQVLQDDQRRCVDLLIKMEIRQLERQGRLVTNSLPYAHERLSVDDHELVLLGLTLLIDSIGAKLESPRTRGHPAKPSTDAMMDYFEFQWLFGDYSLKRGAKTAALQELLAIRHSQGKRGVTLEAISKRLNRTEKFMKRAFPAQRRSPSFDLLKRTSNTN